MDNYIIAKATNVGRTRQVNEDSMTVFNSPNGLVLAVCDGMGGQAAGDTASQLTVSIIESILTDNSFTSPQEAIQSSVMAANQGVLNKANQTPELNGMGATCAMIIVKDNLVFYGWVGDSRIYYIANHTIRQVSHDQSYVQQMVDSGEITPEEAANHPQRNEILNCIGLQGMTPPLIGAPVNPEPGSVFLICSDGLSSMVSDSQIERVVSNVKLSAQQKVDRLVELANEAGGLDNITVELIQFAEEADVKGVAAPTASPAVKKGSKNKVLGFIGAIVLAGVLAGGGYYFLKVDNKEETKKEQTDKSKKDKDKDQENKGQTSSTVDDKDKKDDNQKTEQGSPVQNTSQQTTPSSNNNRRRTDAIHEHAPKEKKEETQPVGNADEELRKIAGENQDPTVSLEEEKKRLLGQ